MHRRPRESGEAAVEAKLPRLKDGKALSNDRHAPRVEITERACRLPPYTTYEVVAAVTPSSWTTTANRRQGCRRGGVATTWTSSLAAPFTG